MREKIETQFVTIFRKLIAEYRHELKRDVTGPQIQVLEALERNGSSKVSEVAEMLYVTVGAVTLLSDRLLKAGLLTRERSERDRRVVMLSITDQGRELLTEIKGIRRRLFAKYFGTLTEDDLRDLNRILNKVTEMLGEGDYGRTR